MSLVTMAITEVSNRQLGDHIPRRITRQWNFARDDSTVNYSGPEPKPSETSEEGRASVQPVYGRDFTMDEERPGTAARSVIVSYKVWERSGLDRDILKHTVRINGQDFAVVACPRNTSPAPQPSWAPSITCRLACTMRSQATSTATGAFRSRIAAAVR